MPTSLGFLRTFEGKLGHTRACSGHCTPGTLLAPGQAGKDGGRVDIAATRRRDRVIDQQAVARHTARHCTLRLYTDETRLRYPPGTYADLVQCGMYWSIRLLFWLPPPLPT